jgi:tetratricopeptide (TPR) repeat protein
MMAAAKTITRAFFLVALLTAVPLNTANGQQTMQVAAPAEVREFLRHAESLLAAGDSQGAWQLLEPRESELSGNAYFDYLLGVAALDSGRTNEAILSLRRAASAAPQFSGARMELARAHYEAGERNLARPLFVALLGEGPPAGVRDIIEQYISAIDAGPAAVPGNFRPYAELMVGYDDNANGSTDDQQFLGFTLNPENLETDSSFFDAGAGFDLTVPKSAAFAWVLGARAGYRKNPDASFVDTGVVNILGGMNWRSGPFFGRANVDAYWASRDGDSNESYSGVNLLVGRQLNERWELSASLRGGALRYDDAIEILDVNRVLYTLGAAYRFGSRGRFSAEAIGGSDDEQQSGAPYGNSKTGYRLSFNTAIGQSSFLFASVGNLTSDYDGLFFGVPREDKQLTSILQLEFRDVLTDGLTIAPRIRYIDNDSDVALYDYDRAEIGLLIRWVPK